MTPELRPEQQSTIPGKSMRVWDDEPSATTGAPPPPGAPSFVALGRADPARLPCESVDFKVY
jgi:hypothetical protein